MNFHELLEKYKEGTLTEEEKLLVESELEKNEAINDYLSEGFDFNATNNEAETSTLITPKKIKSSVNKKLVKIVVISVILVFAIILGTKYIVSPLVASKYYNPTTQSMDEFSQDIFFDLRAINEVTNPGFGINGAYATSNGFGEYDFYFDRTNLLTGETSRLGAQISKNMKIGSFRDFFDNTSYLYNELWSHPRNSEEFNEALSHELKLTEDKIQHLKELPSNSYVSAYVYLNKDLSMKELSDLVHSYGDLRFMWAAVRVTDDRLTVPIGFRPDPNGDGSTGSTSYYKEYPALFMGDYFIEESGSVSDRWLSIGYTKHFTSLMKYLSNRPKAVEAFLSPEINFKDYDKYIDENGVNTYALLIYANVEDLLSFYEKEDILTINIDNVLPSIYSTKNKN